MEPVWPGHFRRRMAEIVEGIPRMNFKWRAAICAPDAAARDALREAAIQRGWSLHYRDYCRLEEVLADIPKQEFECVCAQFNGLQWVAAVGGGLALSNMLLRVGQSGAPLAFVNGWHKTIWAVTNELLAETDAVKTSEIAKALLLRNLASGNTVSLRSLIVGAMKCNPTFEQKFGGWAKTR